MEAQQIKSLVERALVSYSGTTTGDGAAGGGTMVCSALTGQPDYNRLSVLIAEGAYAGLTADINGGTTGGTITVEPSFPGQIVSGINFHIIPRLPAYSELIDIMGSGFATGTDSLVVLRALVDSAESPGPFSYLDAGGEQDVVEDTAVTRRRIFLEFSNRNMTQTGTFRIYRKVDGANYDLYAEQPVTVAAGDERAFDAEFTTNQQWKLTYEEDVDEGAARAIPYNVITQVIE